MALGLSHLLRLAASRNVHPIPSKIQNLQLLHGLTATASASSASNPGLSRLGDSHGDPKKNQGRRIKIPKRIERSPTDVLDALASTVGRDNTGPRYRYMDDPFFIPTNASNRRIFALAKESGRKAARYIVKKYPDLFKKPTPEPEIPAFLASSQLGFQRLENPTVEDLVERMRQGASLAAFEVYQDLRQKNPEAVSAELQQELLERLCYHNGEDALESDLMEEKWFAHYIQKDVRQRWKVAGPADKLFRDIKPKTPEACAVMICAMAKFLYVEEAYKMLDEMEQENIPVPVQAFNELIKIVPLLKDSIETRWEMTMSLLSRMSQQGVAPNLQTFNAVLEVISKIAMWKRARPLALATLAEMRRCGIEASLASYHHLIQIFCRERGTVSFILLDILQQLEGKELVMRDLNDSRFFGSAMDCASRHLQDVEVAKMVYQKYLEGNNSLFLTDAHKEHTFYASFFRVLVAGESVENFFKLYDEIVPMTFIPDSSLLLDMIKMVEFHDQLEHLPRIWSDAIIFGVAMRENMLEPCLEVLVNNKREELKEQFGTIALDVKTRIEAQSLDRINRIPWTGPVISSVCILLVRNGQLDHAWQVVSNYMNKKTETFGFPNQEALGELVDALVLVKENAKVKQCLMLAADLGFVEMVQRAQELAEKLELPKLEVEQWRRMGGLGSVSASLPEEPAE